VLKRQSLKLLSEFLLERENFKIMMRYISDKVNLKAIMIILRSPQANIQFEAFHVFKVFVANPSKPADIVDILLLNKTRLVAFLQGFQNDKDDDQFTAEKQMLVDTLTRLEPTPPAAPPAESDAAAPAPPQ
jgi:calcium binding protein 39